MRVLLIRHAESSNNVISEKIFDRIRARELTYEQGWELFVKDRVSDPPLTDKGLREASFLAQALTDAIVKQVINKNRVEMYCSGMTRACQTLWPLHHAVTAKLSIASTAPHCITTTVHPDVFEVGGIYVSETRLPGKCLTRKDFSRNFPGYDTSLLKPGDDEMWYDSGHENKTEARERAVRVARWIQDLANATTAGLEPGPPSLLVVVSHADFLDMLLKQMLGIEGPHTAGITPSRHIFNFANTAHAMLSASGQLVSMDWMGRTDHLLELTRTHTDVLGYKAVSPAASKL